ncbi:hypothetical protein SHI21_09070 [Bacteriovorax sp. PP10]|uniref:Lipoprotein n=1 Tax=Bacteriovorax antarcticus TaxID=3088717 RepID=A0ABU5VTU5_9BACT|nr:hypothetical protein [Bacteriovorax sp. PP10]MEA9356352.1 hypothetical protein [Bacteriovorax sp. PP10]
MKKYSHYLFLILVVSCAGNEKKTPPKTYSEDTNRAFEMIERGGSYYLKKAPVSAVPPQIEVPTRRRVQQPPVQQVAPIPSVPVQQVPPLEDGREEIVVDEKINYQAKPLTKEIRSNPKEELTPVLRNTQSTSKADERLIEINQNLAFYCMKHRKDPAYGGDEAKCMKFVNVVMAKCQKQHRIVNSKLLNCIQTKLKNKR